MTDTQTTGFSRMFAIPNRAAPTRAPIYENLWKAGALSVGQGDSTRIWEPDPDRYGAFRAVGKFRGEPDSPELPITGRLRLSEISELLKLANLGCDIDVQVHFGECKNPRDFNHGWSKVLVFEGAAITDYTTDELGALEPGDQAVVNEMATLSGEAVYEVKQLVFAQQAASLIVNAIADVKFCDSVSCGACGITSDGCQVVFAVAVSAAGSPGLPGELIYSQDGGSTWAERTVTGLSVAATDASIACVGSYLLVIDPTGSQYHYALITDILGSGTVTWTTVSLVGTATAAPGQVFAPDSAHIYIAGTQGSIWLLEDIAGTAVQQVDSSTSTNTLNAIHGVDADTVIAVGNLNTVLVTTNSGESWQLQTGPEVGAGLKAVWMFDENQWLIGTSTGKLWYTSNAGVSYTLVSFPGSGAGAVEAIQFATPSVGYISHTTATPVGRILRTLNGGNSWYVLPEAAGATMPTSTQFLAIASCPDVNLVYAGGKASATDGVLVKGA